MSRLVTIAHFRDGPEPYAAAAVLRSAGSHPWAGEFFHAMVDPILFFVPGGVRIQVPEEEADAAAELIADCRSGQGAGADAEVAHAAAREEELCRACGLTWRPAEPVD